MNWIHDPQSEPEIFINEFVKHGRENNADAMAEFAKQYSAGYCWHFAHMLQSVFRRGEVCWAAPFGHMIWLDSDNTAYDIEGKFQREARYLIPEYYLSNFITEFMHIRGMNDPIGKPSTREDLIQIMKTYCKTTGNEYDPNVERYLQ
jgi:hypothetical protein